MEDAIEAVKEAFIVHSEGSVKVPLRINIRSDKYNGNMLFMPAYCEKKDAASLKIVSVYPDKKPSKYTGTGAFNRSDYGNCAKHNGRNLYHRSENRSSQRSGFFCIGKV